MSEYVENVQISGSVSWARDKQHLQHLNSCGLLFSASIVHDIPLPSSDRSKNRLNKIFLSKKYWPAGTVPGTPMVVEFRLAGIHPIFRNYMLFSPWFSPQEKE